MPVQPLYDDIREVALSFPEAYEESPWGDRVVKVRKKIFAFLDVREGRLSFTVKLPESGAAALAEPWAEPTGYGLGRHGWVSMRLDAGTVARDQLVGWLHESYRAVAPKRLVRKLEEEGLRPPPSAVPAPAGPPAVALVGDDALRLERAVAALAERGVAAVCAPVADDTLDLLADAPLEAVVVDLGRNQADALAFAERLALLTDAPIALAGSRDRARAEQAVPRALIVSDAPPADVLAALADQLG